jgi:hypothetical protein
MTKEEALTKWCPFARAYRYTSDSNAVTVNRDMGGKPDAYCLCIADACMAWRPIVGTDTVERGYCQMMPR